MLVLCPQISGGTSVYLASILRINYGRRALDKVDLLGLDYFLTILTSGPPSSSSLLVSQKDIRLLCFAVFVACYL